jgi:rubrerythrin
MSKRIVKYQFLLDLIQDEVATLECKGCEIMFPWVFKRLHGFKGGSPKHCPGCGKKFKNE